jgi:putative chitinase
MLLTIGSVGEEVRKLQAILGLKPDGSFGPVTEKKVREWQVQHNLPPDGTVSDILWGILFPGSTQSTAEILPQSNFRLEDLRDHIPLTVLVQVPETARKFDISNPLRLSHFLAQCAHESNEFNDVFEKLNYSADRLNVIFPKHFPGNLSDSYANNPVRIASRVYANRNGNGDEESGDGYTYRGRGFIQLTGKTSYANFAEFIGEDTLANPDLVATKYPLASAAFFFTSNHIWNICDRGDTAEVLIAVTKAVNGGATALAERIKHFNDYYNLLR